MMETINAIDEEVMFEYEEDGRVLATGRTNLELFIDYLYKEEGKAFLDSSNWDWRDVVGYEGLYEVSNYGIIWSTRTGKAMSPQLKYGREADSKAMWRTHVVLTKGGVSIAHKIHKIVAQAFLGDAPEGMVVSHLNDRPIDNRISNLAYATRAENNNIHNALQDVRRGRLTSDTILGIARDIQCVVESSTGIKGVNVDYLAIEEVNEIMEYTGVSEGTVRMLNSYLYDGSGLYSILDLDEHGYCYVK